MTSSIYTHANAIRCWCHHTRKMKISHNNNTKACAWNVVSSVDGSNKYKFPRSEASHSSEESNLYPSKESHYLWRCQWWARASRKWNGFSIRGEGRAQWKDLPCWGESGDSLSLSLRVESNTTILFAIALLSIDWLSQSWKKSFLNFTKQSTNGRLLPPSLMVYCCSPLCCLNLRVGLTVNPM